jgi:hypothetical protein
MAATTTTSTTPRHRHPATEGGPFASSSDAIKYLDGIRSHEARAGSAARVEAQRVYRQILATSKIPGGIDKRLAARRERKNWLKIAEGMEFTAKAAGFAIASWYGSFGDPNSKGNRAKRGIDLLK